MGEWAYPKTMRKVEEEFRPFVALCFDVREETVNSHSLPGVLASVGAECVHGHCLSN